MTEFKHEVLSDIKLIETLLHKQHYLKLLITDDPD